MPRHATNFIAGGAAFLALAAVSRPVAGAYLFVKTSGTGSVCTQASPCALATAITNAAGGDAVYVGGGTYTGSGISVLALDKSIDVLGGWDGAPSGAVKRDPVAFETILDGQNLRNVVSIKASTNPTIDGLTITRGNGSSLMPCEDVNGGNADGCGGGIWAYESHPTITNNRIVGNTAAPVANLYGGSGAGGGIYLHSSTGSTIRDNVIADNVASAAGEGSGGGVAIRYYSSGTSVEHNRIVGNSATTKAGGLGHGGGIMLSDTDPNTWVSGNVLGGNTAGLFGSGTNILVFSGHAGVSHNCVLDATSGRSVVFERSSGSLIGNRLRSEAPGTALALTASGEISVINNIVSGAFFGIDVNGETGSVLTAELTHNTLFGNGNSYGVYARSYATVTARNNILAGHDTAHFQDGTSSLAADRTLFFNNVDDGIRGTNPIDGDPLFVNAPRGDLHIQPGSAAIDAATDAGISWDFDGESRPGAGSFDVGADELAPWAFDFGTASSPVAAGWTRVTHATAYADAQGYGWLSGAIAARDRGGPDDLRRDFAFTPLGTFAVAVPNGRYRVTATLGDQTTGHQQMGVYLEGARVDTVTTAAGEFKTVFAEASVTDWQLTVMLDDLGGGDPNVVINSLLIEKALPVKLDLGTAVSPIAPGFQRLAHNAAYSPAAGAGWIGGAIQSRDRGGADALRRDLNFTPRGLLGAFLHNGIYDVFLTLGDAATAHDQMGIFLQGSQVATVTTAKNQFLSDRYCICVADNRLGLLLNDLGGNDANAVVNAVEISPPPLLWFDFGTPTSPIAGGFLQVTHATAHTALRGFGWLSGSIASRERGTGTEVTRDFNFTRDGTFAVDVIPGRYRVTVTLGDAASAHDFMEVYLEGEYAGTVSTAANQFATNTYSVNVIDGQLTVRLYDAGGADVNAVINALWVR
jgi:fibronectin type 3 domain-containing protein